MNLFFSFEGRVNRAAYWLYAVLLLNGILLALVVAGAVIGSDDGIVVAYILGTLALLWPSLAFNVKRCHDRNRSGAFVLVSLVPLLNLWYLVEILFLPGTAGANQYGQDPLSAASTADASRAPAGW